MAHDSLFFVTQLTVHREGSTGCTRPKQPPSAAISAGAVGHVATRIMSATVFVRIAHESLFTSKLSMARVPSIIVLRVQKLRSRV